MIASPGSGKGRWKPFLLHGPDIYNKVFGIAETAGRNAFMLFVSEGDAFSGEPVDATRHLVIPDAEQEFVGDGSRHRDHRHFTFPCLADPAALGKLLNVTDPLARGKAPREGKPDVKNRDGQQGQDETRQPQGPAHFLIFREFIFHKRILINIEHLRPIVPIGLR